MPPTWLHTKEVAQKNTQLLHSLLYAPTQTPMLEAVAFLACHCAESMTFYQTIKWDHTNWRCHWLVMWCITFCNWKCDLKLDIFCRNLKCVYWRIQVLSHLWHKSDWIIGPKMHLFWSFSLFYPSSRREIKQKGFSYPRRKSKSRHQQIIEELVEYGRNNGSNTSILLFEEVKLHVRHETSCLASKNFLDCNGRDPPACFSVKGIYFYLLLGTLEHVRWANTGSSISCTFYILQ